MKRVFIINGSATSGKDTFVDFITNVSLSKPVFKISSVDRVKEAAKLLGWNGVKDEIGRQFLVELKDLSTKFYDGPVAYMEEQIDKGPDGIYFLMIREPEEITRFVAENEYMGIKTILVKRGDIKTFHNHADKNVSNYNYDFVIENNGTLEELEKKAALFYLKYCRR
jgi:hypothetical protein